MPVHTHTRIQIHVHTRTYKRIHAHDCYTYSGLFPCAPQDTHSRCACTNSYVVITPPLSIVFVPSPNSHHFCFLPSFFSFFFSLLPFILPSFHTFFLSYFLPSFHASFPSYTSSCTPPSSFLIMYPYAMRVNVRVCFREHYTSFCLTEHSLLVFFIHWA